jgi:hypothetical protein
MRDPFPSISLRFLIAKCKPASYLEDRRSTTACLRGHVASCNAGTRVSDTDSHTVLTDILPTLMYPMCAVHVYRGIVRLRAGHEVPRMTWSLDHCNINQMECGRKAVRYDRSNAGPFVSIVINDARSHTDIANVKSLVHDD